MTEPKACPDCMRRARLLAHLAPYIEKSGAHHGRVTPSHRLRECTSAPSKFCSQG